MYFNAVTTFVVISQTLPELINVPVFLPTIMYDIQKNHSFGMKHDTIAYVGRLEDYNIYYPCVCDSFILLCWVPLMLYL